MNIIEITDIQKWNNFIINSKGSFLQSWEWGEVQRRSGKKIWRLGLVDGDSMVQAILIIKYPLFLGKSYFFSPWANWLKEDYKEIFIKKISEIAHTEKAIFFRYEPFITHKENDLKQYNFRYAGQVEPIKTLLIDLSKSKEELLSEIHSKTRYNIRLAEKKSVVIKKYESLSGKGDKFEYFWKLVYNTYERKGIKAHLRHYYEQISKQDIFQLYVAEYDGKIIVANLLSFFGNTATYLHGGSDKDFQKTMAASLVQWQAIKDAKEKGYKYYDFYGIASSDNSKDAWAGITRFKKGFGGFEKKYVGAWDFVFSGVWCCFYKFFRFLSYFRNLIKR